jgi:hypothetical protein
MDQTPNKTEQNTIIWKLTPEVISGLGIMMMIAKDDESIKVAARIVGEASRTTQVPVSFIMETMKKVDKDIKMIVNEAKRIEMKKNPL